MRTDYAKHETVTIEGVDYVSPSACSFGDYGGCGSYGLANIRYVISEAESMKGEVFETNFSALRYASEGSYFPFEDELELRAAVKQKRKPLVLHVTGDYSSETVYILRHSKLAHDVLSALADYPSLDDEASSSIEMDWESEAWDSWLRSDLERAAWPGNDEPESDEASAAYSAMSDDDKFSAYRFAMDVENEYPEAELNGVHVRVENIAGKYRETIERIIAGESLDDIRRKQWSSLYQARA